MRLRVWGASRRRVVLGGAVALFAGCGGPSADDIGPFVGSCGITAQQNCIDYGSGYNSANAMSFCGATYSLAPCPTTGRLGHCIYTVHPADGAPTQVFRESYYAGSGYSTSTCTSHQGVPFDH